MNALLALFFFIGLVLGAFVGDRTGRALVRQAYANLLHEHWLKAMKTIYRVRYLQDGSLHLVRRP
jgi:hypothetical protein